MFPAKRAQMKKQILTLILTGLVIIPFFGQENKRKTIHQEQLEYYNAKKHRAEDYYRINQVKKIAQNISSEKVALNKIVFGWHPYWSNGLEVNYDWSLLSDLSYFSYEVNPLNGNPHTTHAWESASVIDDALANGVRVNLCVTLFSEHAAFLGNLNAQETLTENLITLVQARNAHGVNIDFEGVDASLEPQFTSFLINLCTQMHAEIPGSKVSVCTYSVDWGNIINETAIDPYIDYYLIMGYDYYYGSSPVAGPTSPLYTFDAFNYNLAKSVNYYLSEGASKNKLVLGLPYYGKEWNTETGDVPSNTTSFVSNRTYKTIKSNTSGNYSTRLWEPTAFCPYYTYNTGNWRQCFIDDEESLAYKYDLVNMVGIAGIGIWALGYDDGYTELWDVIRNKFTDSAITPCTGTFYDLGGPYKDYLNKSDYSFTIAPNNASQINLEFPVFDIEAGSGAECNYDYIEIFDGSTTASPSLGKFCNTTGNPGTISSSGNALTLHVHTDGATVKSGFEGNWSCVQDTVLPQTQISGTDWAATDFDISFTDTDNDSVKFKFYQVTDYSGTEWRANAEKGFFQDNFNAELHPEWTQISGTWSVNNNCLMQSDESLSNNNLYTNLTQTSGNIYLYQWKMKISGAGTNRRAGIYFFCSNPELSQRENAYMVYFRADQNACQIYKSENNTISLKTNDYVNVNSGEQYDCKVIYNSTSGLIQVFQNNHLVSQWTDTAPLQAGNSISLRTGNCIAEYDDIQVYKSRNAFETVRVGASEEVRYQNPNPSIPACCISSIVTDMSGNISNPAKLNVNIDFSAPENIASVNDGPGTDIDTTYVAGELKANWTQAIEPNSHILNYQYCIGLSPGAEDLVPLTDNGTSTEVTCSGLNLSNNTAYFFSVRAFNTLNLASDFTTSNGIVYINPGNTCIADFTLTDTILCSGDTVHFINLSENASAFLWTITGAQNISSTEAEPAMILPEGNYEIELIAYGTTNNDTLTKTVHISQIPKPLADFSAEETNLYLPNAEADFENKSSNADSYLWNFGDGYGSTETEPLHSYMSEGIYTVSLEASSYKCGRDTSVLENYIHVLSSVNTESAQSNVLYIYPNPAKDNLYIFSNQDKILSAKLYTIDGQLLIHKRGLANKVYLNMSTLPSSVYLLKVKTAHDSFTSKIIVKR